MVSDTSAIINLASVRQLDLLRQLYGKIAIPQAVYHEITVVGAGQPGATEVQTSEWIETREVANDALTAALQMELDVGEAETIALAVELKADLLLLDESLGRTLASRLGLKFIGLLGVLIEAKDRGLVPSIKPILDSLITKAGFWISDQLYARVLQEAGE